MSVKEVVHFRDSGLRVVRYNLDELGAVTDKTGAGALDDLALADLCLSGADPLDAQYQGNATYSQYRTKRTALTSVGAAMYPRYLVECPAAGPTNFRTGAMTGLLGLGRLIRGNDGEEVVHTLEVRTTRLHDMLTRTRAVAALIGAHLELEATQPDTLRIDLESAALTNEMQHHGLKLTSEVGLHLTGSTPEVIDGMHGIYLGQPLRVS